MNFRKHLKALLGIAFLLVGIFCLLMLAAAPARADTQGMPSTITAPTNLPATVTAATAVTQTSVVNLRQPRGIAVSWSFNVVAAGATAQPCTIWLYPTPDGTNYSTKTPFTLTGIANGATTVTVTTNWPRATLEGYTALNFGMISNGSASTLTNLGVVINIPNQ